MCRRNGFRAVALAALVAAPAPGQDAPRTTYWPLRKIDFPVPVADLQRESKRPKLLRFFVARDGERFTQAAEKAPDQLDPLGTARGQRGFSYTTDRDGVYDFAVQFVYPDGTAEPKEADLKPEWRVTFDTRPPVLTVRQSEPNRLEWEATDEHLGPSPVTVETRWPGGRWTPVPRPYPPKAGHTWDKLSASDPLEVRLIARDRAGLEAASRVFTLPSRGDGGRLPAAGFDDAGPAPKADARSGFGNPPDPDQPPTEYVRTREFVVQSKLSRVTRSGVKKAYLWVNDGKLGWKPAGELDQNILGGATDKTISMGYKAPADGLYGFLVIPESFAGTREADPTAGTRPQYYVYSDTQPPGVQITRAEATPGGAAGPRLLVEWRVTEAGSGLLPDSITLEYSKTRDGPWRPITPQRVENSGRYTWEVDDKSLWQCFVKVTATDKAGNSGFHVFDKEVFLDLEKPAAVIEKVVGGAGGGTTPAPSSPAPEPARPPDPLFPTTGSPASKPAPAGPAPNTLPTKLPPSDGPAVPKLPDGNLPTVPSLPPPASLPK